MIFVTFVHKLHDLGTSPWKIAQKFLSTVRSLISFFSLRLMNSFILLIGKIRFVIKVNLSERRWCWTLLYSGLTLYILGYENISSDKHSRFLYSDEKLYVETGIYVVSAGDYNRIMYVMKRAQWATQPDEVGAIPFSSRETWPGVKQRQTVPWFKVWSDKPQKSLLPWTIDYINYTTGHVVWRHGIVVLHYIPLIKSYC